MRPPQFDQVNRAGLRQGEGKAQRGLLVRSDAVWRNPHPIDKLGIGIVHQSFPTIYSVVMLYQNSGKAGSIGLVAKLDVSPTRGTTARASKTPCKLEGNDSCSTR